MEAPDLSVIVSTHARPVEVREAIDAIVRQRFDGVIETIVVFDKAEPDTSLESSDRRRPVRVTANGRGHGLPGSRNAGAEMASSEVLSFCDDDDLWLPDKAARQLALLDSGSSDVVTSGIEILHHGERIERRAPASQLNFEDLLVSRRVEANMVTAMVRRTAFWDVVGPMDEQIPGGYGEDYDWMLRATRVAPVSVVPEPLVQVRWNSPSHFRRWDDVDAALGYLLDRHPEFRTSRCGLGRLQGQRAFARAAGRLGSVWPQIWRTARANPLEPRTALAAAVAMRLVRPETVLDRLNRSGRGI